jgi:hypothetical protein
MSFPGTHGSVIYLQNYLSTMFQISDVMIDKDEVAMTLNIKIVLPEKDCIEAADSVSKTNSGVSNAAMETLVEKVAQILTTQGFSCFGCPKSTYKLYPLSDDCREAIMSSRPFREGTPQAERYRLAVSCGDMEIFHFELTLTPTGRFDRRA